LVVGHKQIGTIDANIERFDKLLTETSEIYKNGFAEKLDVDKVSVQLNNLRTEKIKAENQLKSGYAGLKFLINMPQKDSLVLTDSLDENQLKADVLNKETNYKDHKRYQLLEVGKQLSE
jgi:outer membrane protein TolC